MGSDGMLHFGLSCSGTLLPANGGLARCSESAFVILRCRGRLGYQRRKSRSSYT